MISIIMLTGGIGFFFFGMKLMTKSIENLSKSKIADILSACCSTTVRAVIFGSVITAFLQSSSAVSVMAVSFVESSVLSLSAAAGIILGANVGTTATSALLAFSQGASNLFSGEYIICFLSAVASFPFIFSKKEKVQNISCAVMGLAVLMTGMEIMCSAMKPLAENSKTAEFFTMFSNPLLGILAGTIVTAVIQSSSVSVGILQALSVSGCITIGSAIPIVMGQNIGTCFTSLLACAGGKPLTKKTAMLNLYFNIAGTVFFAVLLYTLDYIVDFSFMNNTANSKDIATIHILFNIASTVIMMPLIKPVCNVMTAKAKLKRPLR